ncbi:MAG TPA: protein kinase [Gemmatimonadales bacterium]|nr:protein kinase [Gemmatimonadales bacterium]
MAELPIDFTAQLADRYRVERELGRGGMATVYLAHDLKHDRPVALKVLHAELAALLGPERFQREIRFAARLQHPHILTVLDSGEAAGQLWFTMPYVEGESLRDRLRRERQLPVEEALRITREAAQALQYAHDHGVIHRDIKPENLLLTTDGNTLVADFGIARGLGSGEQLTQTGMSIGTPAYMSPEQASGDKAVDARSDLYSLAAVLYEMLAGEPPYTGPSVQAVLIKRFTEPVPSVRKARPSVPDPIDQALQRALAPIPADRFSGMAQFAQVLQGGLTGTAPVPSTPVTAPPAPPMPTAAPAPSPAAQQRRRPIAALSLALGFLIGLGVLFAWKRNHDTLDTGAGAKRLAVLPFENLGDSADAYFADGMTDEVRGKLSEVPGLAVIARSSSNEYRHSSKGLQEIARELGADYLLTATVRWEKRPDGTSRVRVSPELVRVVQGMAPTTNWQQAFDAALTDVFQVQADIAGKVAAALNVALGDSARQEIANRPTANLAAYDAFLKGEAASQGMSATDPASLRRAIDFYSQAVTLDSSFVPAWVELARAHSLLYYNSTPSPAEAEAARLAAERAQALGQGRPEGALAMGSYYASVLGDPPRALDLFQAGLKLAPNNVDLLVATALAEQSLGRWDDALQHLERAGTLDPRSAQTARRAAFTLLWLRRYPEAEKAADHAVALAPTGFNSIETRAMVALAQGDLAGAQGVLRNALHGVDPGSLLAYFGNYWDLCWALDDAQQQQVLTLGPGAFDNDRGVWGIVHAQISHLRGDSVRTRIYADSARMAYEQQIRTTPNDGQQHAFRGLALAYLGRKADAIAEGERAVALAPASQDAYGGPYNLHQLARIYLLVGEPDKALDLLERLLKMPYYLSPEWLRIDPSFAPLHGNPRFERLIAGK